MKKNLSIVSGLFCALILASLVGCAATRGLLNKMDPADTGNVVAQGAKVTQDAATNPVVVGAASSVPFGGAVVTAVGVIAGLVLAFSRGAKQGQTAGAAAAHLETIQQATDTDKPSAAVAAVVANQKPEVAVEPLVPNVAVVPK